MFMKIHIQNQPNNKFLPYPQILKSMSVCHSTNQLSHERDCTHVPVPQKLSSLFFHFPESPNFSLYSFYPISLTQKSQCGLRWMNYCSENLDLHSPCFGFFGIISIQIANKTKNSDLSAHLVLSDPQ